jgi:VWFA-related protein
MRNRPWNDLLKFLPALAVTAFLFSGAAPGQSASSASSGAVDTIKVESRVVLVDTVVTDKKGNYIRDLAGNDFKIWEDGKEQAVSSFSREETSSDPSRASKHYLVLFFDDTTMEFADQAKARDAATKFIASNTAPNRLIAIVEFGGMVRIAQNFTADAERLKKVIAGVKFSTVSPNGPSPDLASTGMPPAQPEIFGMPSMGGLEADFGARSVFTALRNLAKGLSAVPGRKTLVMLTAGFPMTMELESELNAVIDACNKANVAVYPIDVRGLTVPMPTAGSAALHRQPIKPSARLSSASLTYAGTRKHASLRLVSFPGEPAGPAQAHGGTGSGGTGGAGGGHGGTGTGGSGHGGTGVGVGSGGGGRTGVGSAPGSSGSTNGRANPPRPLMPQMPTNVATNQQFLYQLAEGTGGFVIVNTNNLLGGIERIANDQSEYYLLSYKPPESPEGSCHALKVKVDRAGTNVRFRSGYCKVRPLDLLAGSVIEKDLENKGAGELAGNVTAVVRVPYFYTAPEVARVHLVMDVPSKALPFEKVKGKQHAGLNVLGIAYKPDGSVAARFSDTVDLDFDGKKEVEEFQNKPFHYEKQFDIAAGNYKLKVVFSSGNDTFGKVETPLAVRPYDGKKIGLSSIVLSNNAVKVADVDQALDSQLLDDSKPLIIRGLQVFPSATNHFKKTDKAIAYIEVYDPSLAGEKPPQLGMEYRIIDTKTGAKKLDVGVMDTKDLIKPGNPMVPIGVNLPLETLVPGTYRVDLRAEDSAGNSTDFRIAEFELE